MRCLYPRTVGFKADGKTICWSKKQSSSEYAKFKLPCGKCIECRLEYARQWAVRCVHEAKMHENNTFITLTYSDENLKSPKLIYKDFQDFMKRLRTHIWESNIGEENGTKIGVFVTGEYGDITKRPHWHAIIFNYQFPDLIKLRKNDRGDQIFKSAILDKLWGKNNPNTRPNEVGTVTFESAGYVARYAAKKLTHGMDSDHEYHPISKKSSKNAIGKAWLEKYWKDLLIDGQCIVFNSQDKEIKTPMPRYYEKWLLKHHPEEYIRYVTEKKSPNCTKQEEKFCQEWEIAKRITLERLYQGKSALIDKTIIKKQIINERYKRLQQHLKGD